MRIQVLNNCQGPHYIQGQKAGNMPGPLLVLHPGINLVEAKQLVEMRKANKQFDGLFGITIKPSKAPEADPRTFGKPMLEVHGKELDDKAPLAALPFKEASELIALTQDTDLLKAWLDECVPGKQSELTKAISTRLKEITSGIEAG